MVLVTLVERTADPSVRLSEFGKVKLSNLLCRYTLGGTSRGPNEGEECIWLTILPLKIDADPRTCIQTIRARQETDRKRG